MASSNSTMDPDLWSMLQQYVDLKAVYLRLPLWSFFQLRGVCKEWNTLAQQRRCFTERLQKPYFVIVYPVKCPVEPYHVGILTLQIASGQWRWKRLPLHLDSPTQLDPPGWRILYVASSMSLHYAPFSMHGLVFHSFMPSVHQVYDTHTKERHPPISFTPPPVRLTVVAMAVDTSATPYDLKIIIGGLDLPNTTILTRSLWSWSQKICPARIPAITRQTWPECRKSCVQRDECVYVWWQTTQILVYSLKEEKWTALNPPENDGAGGALGCWDSRLFVVMEDREFSVSVWELADELRQAWRRFAHIPGEMYSWLVASGEAPILASFCERYVLMYTLLRRIDDRKGMRDNFVLFDLATKHWQKTSLRENTQSDSVETGQLGELVATSGRR